MPSDLERRIQEILQHPQNLGELADADAVGEVGNSSCGEMLRLWIKFKEQEGRRAVMSRLARGRERLRLLLEDQAYGVNLRVVR